MTNRDCASNGSLRWALVFASGLVLAPVASALAQPQPSPSGSAKAQPKPDAGAAARDAGAPASDGGTSSPSGQLPSGHPPVGGKKPDSRGGGDTFDAPEDTAADDPALPAGTLVATIRDAQDRPIPQAQATLVITRSSVAKGDATERREVTVDDEGSTRFANLAVGMHAIYRITAANGPARFASRPFQLSDKLGKRVTLHVYPTVGNLEELRAGSWGIVYLQLREDAITVEQHVTVLNVDPVAWIPNDYSFGLPAGFKAFTKSNDGDEDLSFDEVKGEGATLRGTVTPGQHDVIFRYQVPLENEERQTFRIQLPPKTFQIGVMAEASKSMALEVSGFPATQRTERNGKRLLVTKKQASGATEELRTLEITLTGLPTPGPGRWIAIVLGVTALIGGLAYARTRPTEGLDDDQRADLVEAKQALLDEMVALERAHRSGEVGPKTYVQVRAALLDALGRIVDKLEQSRPVRRRHAHR